MNTWTYSPPTFTY